MPPRKSKPIPSGLRQFLRQHDRVSQVKLADALIPFLEDGNRPIVFDEERLWRYEPSEGIFVMLENAEVANLIYDLDGLQTAKGKYRVSNQEANSVLRVIERRLTKNGFFFAPPEGVSVSNGFLAIENNKITLRPHTPDQKQRSRLEVRYNENADSSACDAFLYETFADNALVDLIYEVIGVALFGYGGHYQTIIVFYGEGANGKGVITKLIQNLIPAFARSSISPSEWLLDYHRVLLVGSRFNAVGELPPLKGRHMEMFKSITAGDTITVRRLGKDGFEFMPCALHAFSTNHLPPLPETGVAIQRRLLVIPFTQILPPEKRNPKFADELFKNNAEGLLRRAVEGFVSTLSRRRFARPEPVQLATLSWINRSNPVKVFAELKIVRTGQPKDRIAAVDMFKRCCEFCTKENLSIPSSERELRTSLENLGYSMTKSSRMYWVGVRFCNSP